LTSVLSFKMWLRSIQAKRSCKQKESSTSLI
jgi:hypothetical protein